MQSVIQGYRLSPQQEHLCRVRRPGREAGWTAQGRVEIEGTVDAPRLRQALERVIARHEILRTTFHWLPGLTLPVQVVGETASGYLWTEHDLSALAEAESEAALERLEEESRAASLDLTRGPLVRADLAVLSAGRRALLLSVPALVADVGSLRNLADEIACAYGDGAPWAGREAPLQYADAAEILHEWLGASEAAAVSLRGTPAWLPSGRAEPASPVPPRTVRARVERAEAEAAARRAEQIGAPLSVLLLAVWNAVLWHSTGESDLLVGTAFDGRTCVEIEEALGLFVRYLPVSCEVLPRSTLRQLVAALAPRVAELAEAQDSFPLDALEKLLAGSDGAPAWPFGFDCERPAAPRGGSPRFTFRGGYAEADRFAVRLSVFEGSSLRCELHYDPRRVDQQEAEHLLDRFLRILTAAVLAPDRSLAEFDVLSEAERRHLLEDFNRTAAPFPSGYCCHELFEEQARRAPQETALVCGADRLTYQELDARANRLAHHLRALGVGPESLVGLCLERSPESVAGLLAILKAGGAYVPLDPGYPAERLAFMLEDAGIEILLTQERLLLRLPAAPCRVLCLDGEGERREIAQRPAGAPPPTAHPESPAYVIYTSGSTGRPKGVMIPHRGLANYLCWARDAYEVAAGSGAPVHSALGFDLTVTSLLTPLISGTAVTLLDEEQGVGALASALREARSYSLVKITPAHLEVLRQVLAPGEARGAARALVIGGEALWAEGLSFWRENAPATRLINEYGPTETVVGCCVYEVRPDDAPVGPVPIGRPIANTRLYVVGPGLQPVVAGVPGELWIGGAGLARGYRGRPDLTAERFRPDPFSGEPGARLYCTGDLVRLRPDGELEFLGRLDDQVKIRGFRIEPGEIEAALAGHPGVREAAVASRAGSDGNRRLIAWYTPGREPRPSASELRTFLGAKLPEHMIPAVFVPVEALPLTLHGKVDRRALPELPAHAGQEAAYAAPRTVEEELLAEILAGVLGVGQIGIDDDFFALGGDSIRSVQVLSIAQERGLSLSLQELFRRPTIRALSPYLRTGAAETAERTAPFSLMAPADRERLPAGLEDAYPLSRLQAGMLFHSAYNPGSAVYHDLHSFHLRGRCDRDALQAAVDRAVRRHAVLRTSFDLSTFGEPLQLVHAAVPLELAVDDLRHLPDTEQRAAVDAWLAAERHRGFDWGRPPLVRFHVHLRGGDAGESFQFTLSFHHAVLDGWSAGSLLTELFRVYTELLAGAPPREEPPSQATFRDFIHLEQSTLRSPAAQEAWRRQLAGAAMTRIARWPLPAAVPAGAQDHIVPIPNGVADGLRRLGRSLAVPLKSVLLAAHLKVISAWSGAADVLTGLVANGRPEWGDGDRVLGLFLNTLPFRFRLAGESWEELVQKTFELEWSLLAHRRFPLADLQALHGGGELFETAFNFLQFHVYQQIQQDLGGLTVLARNSYEETNFPLGSNFQLDPGGSQLHLRLNYPGNVLAAGEVEAIGACYLRLLAALAEAPSALHREAPVLSTDERRQVLAGWSSGGPAAAPPAFIPQLFEELVRRSPAATALAWEGGRLSYAELNTAANRVAHHLRGLGAGPEARVGLHLERSPEMVVGVLGVLKAGAAYVPLDPGYPAERLAFLTADAGIAVTFTRERLAGLLAPTDTGDPGDLPASPADHLAYVIYTSGSTGRPKGVLVPHTGLANLAAAQIGLFGVEPGDRVLQFAPPTFDASVSEILMALLAGAELHLPGADLLAGDLAASLRRQRITHLTLPPSVLAALPVEALGLKTLVVAGEACPPELARRWLATGVRMVNAYGPTEATVCATAGAIGSEMPGGRPAIGRPIPGARLVILGPGLTPVPTGVPGEVFLGGAGLARGYLGRPDLTAERFLPDPFGNAGDRLYRTGDRARWLPGGDLDFLGRVDEQVKVRGFRIEPGEVEAALAAQPGVRQVAVLAREEGAGNQRLVAYAVPEPGWELSPADLRHALAETLPDFMVPASIVLLDELPRTAHGKLDRAALPVPGALDGHTPAYAAPRTPAEEVLAGVWAEVLRRPRVGIHDDFFAMGGDSILSIQITTRAQRQGVHITPRLLFQHPTVAELAAVSGTVEETEAEPEPVAGPIPLTPIQRWFFAAAPDEPHHFNQAVLLATRGRPDTRTLSAALAAIEAHHDALRLRFRRGEAGWEPEGRGLASGPTEAPLTVVDLSALAEAAQPLQIEAAAAQAQASLHLEQGPIHRTLLLDCGAARPGRLFWAAHHLAVDGVSWRVLLDDLASAYGRIAAGAPPGLPPKTTSFRRWAERLAGLAASGSGREELPFWLGLPWSAAAPLPAEVPPATGPDIIAAERTVAFTLDEDETQALLQEVPRAYNTRINDALLSALARAFQEWTGSPVLPVDLEGHGREEILPGVDLSRTVGWFTSLYPVLLDLRQGSGVAGALKAVKEQLRRVPNGGIGYGLLRWWPDTAAELAALPQPEISFNYLGQLGGPSEVSPFGPARESAGPPRSPAARRRHRLDWNGTVFAGRLRLTCTYSERRDRRETIERLASSVAAKLRELIAHCRSAEAGGYTPSDFPLAAHLSQDRLDALVAARRSPGGTARPIDDVYPVSPMQEGMLFHALYAPERGSYVWQLSCRIVGPLDLPVFRRAWERVLARHDILRTAFVWEDLETPLQVVSREPLLPLEVRDWSGATPAGQRALLEEYLDHDQRRGFDLRQSPLIRLLLAREAADRHRLVWSTQMLLLDGWSMAAVIGDVFLSYDAFLRGEDPQPPLPRRYRDYIEWLLRQDRSAAEPIWRRELAGFPAATPLPGDLGVHGRSGHAGAGSQEQRRTLVSAGDTSALQSYARRNGLTLNTLVQGAWSLLLGRANGETDIVFGATVSGRPPELTGIESMVGLFINTLPVRARIEPEANLADWLRDLQERHTEVRQYEHTPLRDIQGWSDVPRGQQLFDSVVVFESYPVDTSLRERRGTLGTDEVRLLETTNYPLVLAVVPGRQLSLQLTWDTSRFQSATVARLLERLAAVLAGLPAGGRLRDVPAVPAAERHQVLYEWSRGGDLPGIRPVVERFAEQAARTPDAPALVFAGRWVTYGELDAQAGRVARRLAALGVGPGAAVGLCTERSPEMIAGLLGIWRAGGAYLPLDPSYPDARLAFLLQDSLGGGERGAAAVVLTPAALVNRLSTLAPGGCHFAVLEEALAGPDGGGALPRAGLDDPAYLIYTSGTTGAPKAVVVEHRNLASTLAAASAFDFTAADRMPCLAPFSFDIFLFELLGPLLAGGTSHLFALQPALDLAGLVESLGEATLLHAVPALMRQVAEAARDRGPYPGLRAVFVGGDAVPADLLAELPALFPRARVHVLYGPTEATIICCSQTVDPGVAAGPGATLLGRPLPNAEIALLDRWGDPAPIGAPGELCIGGGSVARGYLSRPELDAERFFVRDGRRFYRSGDLARWSPAGRLEFLGRIDHQVKVRGFRIELGEIEAALAAQPGVREAVATVREDGAGNRRLVAYAVPEAGRALDPAELRRALAERLPDYMVPAFVVPLEVLPLTAHGKVDHRALPEPVAAAPEAGEGALPRTRVESLLAGIWAEVLRLPRVGIHDNFFALGGDSILSIQVTTRAQRLGIAISPGLVFQHPTIAELAAVAGTGRSAQAEQGPVTGPVPLLPVQRQFLENDPADPHHFNQSLLFETAERLDPAVLAGALARLEEHHDALRMRYRRGPAGWEQTCAAPGAGDTPLVLADLSALDPAVQPAAVETAAAQAQTSLDLEAGPVHRPVLFDLGAGRPGRLLWAVHHLVVDGVSWRVLLEDLAAAHGRLAQGRQAELPAKTTSFRTWGERLAEHAASPKVRAELAHWLALPWGEVRPLAVDLVAEGNTLASERVVAFSLDPEETRALLQEVPRAYNTQINDALLSALARAFQAWTGSPVLLVNLEGHGREEVMPEVDLSRTVGWLTTVFPVLLDLREGSDPGTALKSVKEQLRRIPGRGLTWGVLRGTVPELAALPRPEVGFNYLGQLDQALPAGAPFRPARERSGPQRSPRAARPHLLDWNGTVFDGRLQIACSFSEQVHRRATVVKLAEGVAASLRELIAHCRSPQAGGYTPSDFPLTGLSQTKLDKILAARKKAAR